MITIQQVLLSQAHQVLCTMHITARQKPSLLVAINKHVQWSHASYHALMSVSVMLISRCDDATS